MKHREFFYPEGAMKGFLAFSRWAAVLAVIGIAVSLATKASWHGVKLLDLFWQGIVPLVPLILLLAPHFWRRICPVAVLNVIAARIGREGRGIGPSHLPQKVNVFIKRYGVMLAASLLWLLVPMRLLLFNQSPRATLVLILAIAVAAVTLGICGQWKAAWCSSVCPVYPVEKLYGAAPVWSLPDTRCRSANSALSCYRCALNCLDVPQSETHYWKAMERAGSKRAAEIVRRFFLGSFPGFMLAYWFLSSTNASARPVIATSIFGVYATFLLLMLASYGCYLLASLVLAANHRVDLIVIALALNLYYAVSSLGLSTVLSQLGGWQAWQSMTRAGIFGFVLFVTVLWLRRAWPSNAPSWSRW